MRRPTIGESRYPETNDFMVLLRDWRQDAIVRMLGFVWSGYDLLAREVLEGLNSEQSYEDLERSVTQYLAGQRQVRVRRFSLAGVWVTPT